MAFPWLDAAEADETARRLQAMPGIGPITASIPVATPPDMSAFRPARDLSAWPGLTPKPHASGGKERLGTIGNDLDDGRGTCYDNAMVETFCKTIKSELI